MQEDPNLKHFIRWAKEHAVSINPAASNDDFRDLAPLKEVIRDARVVGFGESLHYVGEFNRFRSRLFKYLVKEMNFTTFAFECGPIESIQPTSSLLRRMRGMQCITQKKLRSIS